ncbi:MAG: nuclear transport factor 2 family protein [Leptospiraceae bacterium]|nr:nuclear transport factor 2 family protein [Leptospiraceae bacterium]
MKFTNILLLIVFLGIGCKPNNDGDTKIISTVEKVFTGVDERDWKIVNDTFAQKVSLDYTSLTGGSPAILSSDEIISAWKSVLPGFYSTHHQIGNFTVQKNGEQATVKFSGLALHYLPSNEFENVWVVVGTYESSLELDQDKNWKIVKMKFNLQKQIGNLNLQQVAMENVKNGKKFPKQDISEQGKSIVNSFFNSLEEMNIDKFMGVWNENGEQIMPLSPNNFPSELKGKKQISNQYGNLPNTFKSMKFARKIFPTEKENRVIVQYGGKITLKNSKEYNNNYVGIFEWKDSKLEKFVEYFDPEILNAAFENKLQESYSVKSSTKKVEFDSKGSKIVGKLHLPKDFSESKKYTGVIVTGSWTTVKEQMPDLYASKLAEKGYVALTFDFRNYGESEGEPRNTEMPSKKA